MDILKVPYLTIRVVRTIITKNKIDHDSELYIDSLNVNHELINNLSREDLYKKIDVLLNR